VILNSKNERAKNGGVLGVRIPGNFLPASRRVFPARRLRRRALDFSGISDKIGSSGIV